MNSPSVSVAKERLKTCLCRTGSSVLRMLWTGSQRTCIIQFQNIWRLHRRILTLKLHVQIYILGIQEKKIETFS